MRDQMTQREAIIDSLYDHPGLGASDLYGHVVLKHQTDLHNMVHQLWSLQKKGELTFKERKGADGGRGDLTDIDLTPYGRRQAMRLRGIPVESEWNLPFVTLTKEQLHDAIEIKPMAPGGFVMNKAARESTRRHPVGKDMTDPNQHRKVAEGGPVTREKIATPPAPAPVPLHVPKFQFSSEEFPLIWKVFEREGKALRAASLLEDAGLHELSEMTLAAVTYTDFEKEVIRLVRQLGK